MNKIITFFNLMLTLIVITSIIMLVFCLMLYYIQLCSMQYNSLLDLIEHRFLKNQLHLNISSICNMIVTLWLVNRELLRSNYKDTK